MPAHSRLQLTRRTAVGVALLTAGGCTFGGGGEPESGPSESPGVSDTDFDLGLLEEGRAELAGMLDLMQRTSAQYPALSASMVTLVELHQAHDALLADSADEPSQAPEAVRVPLRAAPALELVRKREIALQEEFANLAARARSGPLARVLASMSAAIGQYVVGLPRPKARS